MNTNTKPARTQDTQTKDPIRFRKPKASRTPRRSMLIAALFPLAALAGSPADRAVEVPVMASSYRESVRCMPEIDPNHRTHVWDHHASGLSLEEQEKGALDPVPLHTFADGDSRPDLLTTGADSYRQSVACSPRAFGSESNYRISVFWMPTSSLEIQERLPTESLPAEETTWTVEAAAQAGQTE